MVINLLIIIRNKAACNQKTFFKALFVLLKNIVRYSQQAIIFVLDLSSTLQDLSNEERYVLIHPGHLHILAIKEGVMFE